MAPVNPPAWEQALTYPARIDRLTLSGLLAPQASAGALRARAGVKPSPSSTGLLVTQRLTPDMNVTVGAGTCYVNATASTGGTYLCHNDASYDVAIASAHASLARKDLIVARVYDALDDTGVLNSFAIERVAGTPASSPARPATPNGSIPLAEVLVPGASTTVINANITDLRLYVVALGGLLPITTAADLPASPYPGMAVYRRDLTRQQVYDGAAWRDTFDSGMSFSFGSLAYVFADPSPDQDITTTNEAAASAKVTLLSGLAFTIPAGVPATRKMYVLLSANVGRASGDTFFSFWMDGAALAGGRRMGIPAGPEAHDITALRPFPTPTAGAHILDVRFFNDVGGQTTTFYSGSLSVLLL